ncbi:MAG: ABC transporter permease subunit, partial [Actinomycetota bacterium]|nr:ABC transporter permease subunit [Actinomycetota bacterium]
MAVVRDEQSLLELSALAGATHQAAHPWRRRAIWIGAIVAATILGLALFPSGYPQGLTVDVTKPFNAANDWVIAHQLTHPVFVHVLVPLKNGVNSAVDQVVTTLARVTWLGLLVIVWAASAFLAGWRKGVLAALGFLAIGVLGLWTDGLETLALVALSVIVALAIGIPVGILSARHPRLETVLRPVLDAMQTVPAFSYLVAVVLLFSIGATSAMIATVIFALPPAIRLTSLGIRQVPDDAVEAGVAFGVTKRQLLRKVQLPLARPTIMVGVNQTIMMALGIIVIAATVGYPGLGLRVYEALQGLHVGSALVAGLAIVALAIVLDRVTIGWSERGRGSRGATSIDLFGWSISRRVALVLLVVVAIGAIVVGRQVLRQQEFPDSMVVSIAPTIDRVDRTVVDALR